MLFIHGAAALQCVTTPSGPGQECQQRRGPIFAPQIASPVARVTGAGGVGRIVPWQHRTQRASDPTKDAGPIFSICDTTFA